MSASSDFATRKIKSLSGQNASAPSSGRNTANSSPIENSSSNPSRFNMQHPANSGRMGAGSPSYDGSASGSRLYSKRAREIQQEEGVNPPGLWGPISNTNNPSSLREREPTIHERPSNGLPEPSQSSNDFPSPIRRARAGTLPSRFPPGGGLPAPPSISQIPNTSRPSPATTPFNAPPPDVSPLPQIPVSSAETKSRLRSGSLGIPPRTNYVNPFGGSIFASGSWGRERSATNTGLPSLPSPANSTFSKDDEHMAGRTLDYLGLVDTPQTGRASLARPLGTLVEGERSMNATSIPSFMPELSSMHRNLNRIRSYSVNAKEKYAEDEEEEETRHMYSGQHSGVATPMTSAGAMAAAQATAHAHALAVAQYAQNISPSRSRARTVSALDAPPVNRVKNYLATPSKLDSMTTSSDLHNEYFDLTNSLEALKFGMQRPASGEPGLGPIEESQLEGPTRSLWLGNIPASTTTTSLIHIFQPYGQVDSARVLTHKNCGFINYLSVEHAMTARMALNGKEIFPGAGPTRIGFAKPSSANSGAPTPNGGAYPSASPEPNSKQGGSEGGAALSRDRSNTGNNGRASAANPVEVPELKDLRDDILAIVREFGATDEDVKAISENITTAIEYNDFKPEIPSVPEPSHSRVHDAPKLRDIRKRIDNGNCSQAEVEEIALNMLPEIAELSSDYLGNTVVQKLFEYCSEDVKETMLGEIGPHLAEIGIHKNGTWAGQKIIDVAKTPAQMKRITECLRPYTVALFLDQYGNYVLQCCLRFASPTNDYIFETMMGRLWEISQGRFGSRAMRACLESHHASKNQQRMLAAAIALHSVQLATNANGALLLTWFLDTCNFPRRRTVLAPRLVPHLVHLCTHKVAYLTVLKVINQKNEPEARDTILKAMFFSPNDSVLEDILKDHSCGATLIFKVLTTPFFEEGMRNEVIQNIRNVLLKLKAVPSQGYKRLMDEVGLSTRNNMNNNNGSKDREAPNGNGNGTPQTRRSQANSSVNTPTQAPRNLGDAPAQPQFFNGPPMFDPSNMGSPGQFSPNGQIDPQALRALQQFNIGASLYGPGAPGIGNPAFQYQLLQQQQAQMAAGGRPGDFFMSNMPGFGPQPGNNEQFRGGQGGNPMPPPGMGSPMMPPMGVAPGFNPLVAQAQLMGYSPYGGMNGMQMFGPPNSNQPPQQTGGNTGGRRGGRVRNSGGHGNRQQR